MLNLFFQFASSQSVLDSHVTANYILPNTYWSTLSCLFLSITDSLLCQIPSLVLL